MNSPDTDSLPEQVRVSVIVPLYNVATFIETTIQSLLSQTLEGIEFILVDDGSTDGTYEAAMSFAEASPALRVVHQANGGPASARNQGLHLASGEFVCFIDSDDFMSNDALETMYNAAIDQDADLVMGKTVRFNSERQWDIALYEKHGVYNVGSKHIDSNPELLYAMGPCAKLYRRKIIENTYFPEHIRLGEDQPFVLHAYLNAKKIYTVDSTVYYYRAREGENRSLTQAAMSNPAEVFGDLFEMMRITNDQFAGHHKLHRLYLQRVMMVDILPRYRAALASRNRDVQQKVLSLMYEWSKSSNKDLFNDIPVIYSYIVVGTLYCMRYLRRQNFGTACKLLGISITKMSTRNYFFMAKSVLLELVAIARRRLWRLKKTAKGIVKSFLLKRVYFPLMKLIRPLDPHKVVFATNRSETLQGSLAKIERAITSDYPDWKVVSYPRLERTFTQMMAIYRELATARLIILDDYYAPLYGLKARGKTEVVQAWHASGAFKKFALSAVGTGDSNPLRFERAAHKSYTKVLTTSSSIIPQYMDAFGKHRNQVLPLGLPSNDDFFDAERIRSVKEAYLRDFPMLRNKKILLYAPTFRGSPKERVRFNLKLDLEKMKEALGDEYTLVLKLHPMVRKAVELKAGLSDFVLNLSSTSNINDLLMLSDILISDYSSVIFEYSLLRRPMVFFAYDLDKYLDERGFYYDYASFVPGPIVKTTEELIQTLVATELPLEPIDKFASYFFEHRDGQALQRFMTTFFDK